MCYNADKNINRNIVTILLSYGSCSRDCKYLANFGFKGQGYKYQQNNL